MANSQLTNGINTTVLFETIDAIKDQPELAKFRFKALNEWHNGGHNQTTINEFEGACDTHRRSKSFVFDKDEPPVLLGEDKGANPVEYVLTALAGCLTTSLVYHAAARGITLTEVKAELEGELDLRGFLGIDDEVRNGYNSITVTFHVKGDADDKVLAELVELAKKRSPVFDIISHPVNVDVKIDNKK